MVNNPFRRPPHWLQKQREQGLSVEDTEGASKTTIDSPRDPPLPGHAAHADSLSAIHEHSELPSNAPSLSLSLSLTPSPVEVISVVSSMNMNLLFGLPSSGEAGDTQRPPMSPHVAPPSSRYDEGSAQLSHDDQELMDHPTSYILDTFGSELEMELEFKQMTPLVPESKSNAYGDDRNEYDEEEEEEEEGDDALAAMPAHLLPLSPVSALNVSKAPTPPIAHQQPVSAAKAAKVKTAPSSLPVSPHPRQDATLTQTTENISMSMNPTLALSNDQLERHILSTQEDEDTVIPAGLTRSNAMIVHRGATLEMKLFEDRVRRSQSQTKCDRKKNGNSPPLLFSQNTSVSRSKSLNSVGTKSKLSQEVTAEDITNSISNPKPNPTQSVDVEVGSLNADNTSKTAREQTGSQLYTITDAAEIHGRGKHGGEEEEYDDNFHSIRREQLASQQSMVTAGASEADSPFLVLTTETELNCTKKSGHDTNSKAPPPASSSSSLGGINSFRGNFYKAENNSLNPGPQDTNVFIGAAAVSTVPVVLQNKGEEPPRLRRYEVKSREDFTRLANQYPRLQQDGIHRSSNLTHSMIRGNDDPEDPNRDIFQDKREKLERWKTIGLCSLLVIIVVLLCTFIPLLVLGARGTDDSVKRYLSNISEQHRLELLEPYAWQITGLTKANTTASSRAPEAELPDLGMKSILSITKEAPSGRLRGGLRNSKFKTQTIAGISKFSQIPLTFQSSDELRSVMENDQLHNVFYGIDYAPKNVIYPECGVSLPDVMLDLGLLSQVTSRVRTYGTQCNQTRYVLDAIRKLNLNVSLSVGVWIGANEENNERQIRDLKSTLSDYPREHFESVFVGNEVLFREDQSPERLIRYIQEVKSFVQMELNWDLPVGTSDVGHKTDPSVLNACDFYGSNTHPFFQGDNVEGATQWVFDFMQYQIEPFKHLAMTENKIPKVMISEVGWPSAGGSYRNSTAGEEQMQQFLDAWVCKANEKKYPWYFFEAFDEPWKMVYHRDGAEWETHWGLFTADRTLKEGIRLPNCSITNY